MQLLNIYKISMSNTEELYIFIFYYSRVFVVSKYTDIQSLDVGLFLVKRAEFFAYYTGYFYYSLRTI